MSGISRAVPKRSRSVGLGVLSLHLVDRIEGESILLCSPDFADVFVGCKIAERLETTCEFVCVAI